MSIIFTIFRVTKFAFQDFIRNFWLSVITVSIIILTLFSVNLLLVLLQLAQASITSVEQKIDLTINFKPDVAVNQIDSVKEYLASLPEIKEITYKSQEDVLKDFRDQYKDNKAIQETLNLLESNPLGAALIIKAKSLSDYDRILLALNDESKIPSEIIRDKDFATHKELIARINAITQRLKEIGIGVSIIFIVITVLIVFNTIRVAIYTHRKEIAIMKLVGASNFFTSAPFLINAALLSIIALAITIIIWYPILGVIQPYLGSYFEGVEFNILDYFDSNFVQIFGRELIAIVLLDMISAYIAVRKYLHV